jgi:glutathione synthase/RimK-type ligase-like ATP-grasp enzyme
MTRIAIQPDRVIHPNGERQSFSERWLELARDHHVEAVMVDAFADGAISRIARYDGFMWRYPSAANSRAFARRFMRALEEGPRMPVFPSSKDTWFYEDKLGQAYFFDANDIPHARTHIFWTREAAQEFCNTTDYPFVLKLAGGQQSVNVRLVRDRDDARFYLDQMFCHGVASLGYRPAPRSRLLLRRLRAASKLAKGRRPYGSTNGLEVQYGYFYAQQFLPNNAFEISAIIIGNRAFACRRFVQWDDFRTRGSSGRMDWDPHAIGEDAVRLAFRVARTLGARTVGVDILRCGNEPVVIELTVNYASWVVRECPGHWMLEGDPDSGQLTWVDGHIRAENAIFEDFLTEKFITGAECLTTML